MARSAPRHKRLQRRLRGLQKRARRVYKSLRRLRGPRLWLVYAAIGMALALVLVNALVRQAGGNAALYSVSYGGSRARGLAMLGRHRLGCLDDHGDPAQLVRAAAERQHISPRLALAVAHVESSLVHTKLSATGAMGLMQLMPGTAAGLAVADPFDPAQNADGGTRYLAQLLRMYRGDVRRALAAYNAGMGRIPQRGPYTPPAETVGYVQRVLRRMASQRPRPVALDHPLAAPRAQLSRGDARTSARLRD